jgi:N-carbamoyl-L-amino-acid hydrolase
MALAIDEDRFRTTFETYSEFGATDDGGLHRLTLSDADADARDQLADDMESLGMDVRVDPVGNMFGRYPGQDDDADPVLIGSHLDSQPDGGRYDGQLGVLTALETLRTFADDDIEPARPVTLVNWTNEEGSRFQPALMGSGVYAGRRSLEEVHATTDDDGRTVAGELERIGYDGADAGPDELHSFLELHVEQGPELEAAGDTIGVVDGVLGATWLGVTVEGHADHAAPSPVHTRRDPMATAAAAMDRIATLPTRLSADARTTIGKVTTEPGSVNVIPGEVTFTVDVRSYDETVLDRARDLVENELEAACTRHGTTFDLEVLWRMPPTEFAASVRDAIADAAAAAGAPAQHLVAGANHDACALNERTDAGLMFIPSVDGVSHSPDEFTEWADCVAGATVYANTVASLAVDSS